MDCLVDRAIILPPGPARPPMAPRRTKSVVAASVALHVAALVLLGTIARLAPLRQASQEIGVPVIFLPADDAPAVENSVLSASMLPAARSFEAVPLLPPTPMVVPGHASAPKLQPRAAVRRVEPTMPAAALQHARAAPSSAPPVEKQAALTFPPSTLSTQAALAGFAEGVHRAVQQVASYPAAARLQHRQGRTQLRFDYDDGTVSDEAIVVSSQSASLDGAAMQAVRRAALPRPAPPLGPHVHGLLVWVDFALAYD